MDVKDREKNSKQGIKNKQQERKGNSNYNVRLQQSYKVKLANYKPKQLMIKTRNQNKSQQPVDPKPKINKKSHHTKKELQTDVDEINNRLNIVRPPVNNNPKPKKILPHFKPLLQLKDQVEGYVDEIITYLKGQQAKYKVDENYLKYHCQLNIKVRNFLVKFMFKIVWKYKCKRSTLYLAVYCMDLYFSKTTNFQNNMEAIAVAQASLHIAMKFEEIYPPSLKSWTPDAQQIKKILNYEAQILKTIGFKLNFPSVFYFEQYFQMKFCESQKYKQNKENIYLEELKINLVADLCLFDISLYEFSPFELAKNIRMLVYNIEPAYNQERISLNIKWALERNRNHLDWLKQMKYKELNSN